MNTRVQTPADSPTRNKPRQYGVCVGCQARHQVRRDGLVARHPYPWAAGAPRKPCSGQDTHPLPIDVPDAHPYIGSVPDLPADCVLDRWDFLTMPLFTLLHHLKAEVRFVCPPTDTFSGAAYERTSPEWQAYTRWVIKMPVGRDPLAHSMAVRYLLAITHGIDVTDWPLNLNPEWTDAQ